MLLTPILWATRVWALPFLTVLAPSERYHEQRGKRHKKLTDYARQAAWYQKRLPTFSDTARWYGSSFSQSAFLGCQAPRATW